MIKTVFPKVDPLSVIGLVFEEKLKKDNIYTIEVLFKSGQNLDKLKNTIVQIAGMVP